MAEARGDPDKTARRRNLAEETFRRRAAQVTKDPGAPWPEAAREALYELQVHQIELEMQNEELHEAQEALELSRARYFDLYDLAPIGYITLFESGRILDANLTAAELLGVGRSHLVEAPFTSFILAADQDIYSQHQRRLFETGEAQVCELRLVSPARSFFWARVQSTAQHHGDGARVCRSALSDITDRKQADEALRASEHRHRIMFESSPDALLTLAPPSWRFTSGNASAVTMFEAESQADVCSRTLWHYSPERQPDGSVSTDKARTMMKKAMDDGFHFCVWTFERPSGEKFVATVLMNRIELDGKTLLQATVRDETQMKRLETVLGQADRLASMGMLAAGVAHEINNPLVYVLYNIESLTSDLPKVVAAVKRCASALRNQGGDAAFAVLASDDAKILHGSILEEIVERAREALAGTQRIKVISKALGTFSRVESVERSAVDLNYAIECAITMAFNEIKYRATLVKDLGRVPPIWASEGKLSQVFLNLLINASHAVEEGQVGNNRISIRTWSEGSNAFAEVKDTGKGIAAELLPLIFEPFFTTKPMGIGSGLGLAICRNIVNDFGGEISVESVVGAGTRFVVRLPLKLDLQSDAGAPSLPGARIPSTLSGRILVMDDEELVLKTLTRVLGDDHEVVTADSGAVGRAILERDQSFDVILCDMMMPEMTGMALHEWLEAHHPALADRVVFVSGGAFTPKSAAYLAGVRNRRLDKPIDVPALEALVTQMIGAARSQPRPDGWASPGAADRLEVDGDLVDP